MIKRISLFLILFVCCLGFARAEPRILVLGDSLSAAYGIDQKNGWVELLQQRLKEQGYPYLVINTSISGETTAGGLSRFDRELERHKPSIAIIALGANDGLRGLSLQSMRENLATLIEKSKQNASKVLLVGMHLPPNYGPAYSRAFHQIYTDLGERYEVPLVPFLLEGVGEDKALFQSDGLHPAAEAQPRILENVWSQLKHML